MTEILVDVDFGHPAERVWRALTDRALLSEWFMRTDLEPIEGHSFRLQPDGLLGLVDPLEGELVEVVAPRRMVMLWRGEHLHSRLTWELVPLPEGCRLRMSHTGFVGVKGSVRSAELRRMYDLMLNERLPRVLEQLAAGAAGARRSAPYAVPVPGVSTSPDRDPDGSVPDLPVAVERSSAEPGLAELGLAEPLPAEPLSGERGTDDPGVAEPPLAATVPAAASPAGPPAGRADVGGPPVGSGGTDATAARDGDRDRPTDDAGETERPSRVRRRVLLAVGGVVLVVVAVGALIGGFGVPGFIPPLGATPQDRVIGTPVVGRSTTAGEPTPAAAPSPSAPGGTPGATPAAATGAPGTPPRVGAAPPLPAGPAPVRPPAAQPGTTEPQPEPARGWTASYRTVSASGSGFTGEITVTNNTAIPASGWTVTVTLPEGARITSVKRAGARQANDTVTFRPSNSGKVGPGASVTLEFQVSGGAGDSPTSCRIDGGNCS